MAPKKKKGGLKKTSLHTKVMKVYDQLLTQTNGEVKASEICKKVTHSNFTKLQNKFKNWKKANKKKQELNGGGAADQLHGGGAANQLNYGGLINPLNGNGPMPGPDPAFQNTELERATGHAEWKRWKQSGLIGGPLYPTVLQAKKVTMELAEE